MTVALAASASLINTLESISNSGLNGVNCINTISINIYKEKNNGTISRIYHIRSSYWHNF